MKIEIYPRAEADIVRQFRYYLVDQDAPAAAFRFREALIEVRILHGKRHIRRILKRENKLRSRHLAREGSSIPLPRRYAPWPFCQRKIRAIIRLKPGFSFNAPGCTRTGTTVTRCMSNRNVAADETGFQFLDPGDVSDGVVQLRLVDTRPADPVKDWVPYYVFHICSVETGDRAGEIHLRIGNTDHMRLYGGHIAYGVRPEYRGRHFAARAVRLVAPLAISHGITELWITCNPENRASRRTCELAGAELIGVVDLPPDTDMYQEGERQKCRYRLRLSEHPV